MSIELVIIFVVSSSLITALLTWLISYLRQINKFNQYKQKITELETRLQLETNNYQEKLKDRDSLANLFTELSRRALESNNDSFLKLATENLKQFQNDAKHDLNKRSDAIASLVKPIEDALRKTEQQIYQVEKERKESLGALNQQLESIVRAQENLQSETRNLVTALRRPEVRGKWGEITLRRVAELAGLIKYCDFYEQHSSKKTDKQSRPDMIVKLPADRQIVIDAKTPLDAYLSALECQQDDCRKKEINRHCATIRKHAKDLSAKNYWSQFEQTPDFVIMFIPGEQFLSTALDHDPNIVDYALQQKIIIATPTTLIALLRAIAYGWRQESLERNADQIKTLAQDLYKRLSNFSTHLAQLGKTLNTTLDHYNKAVGSFDRQLMPSAKRMEDLGVNNKQSAMDLPDSIEKNARNIRTDH